MLRKHHALVHDVCFFFPSAHILGSGTLNVAAGVVDGSVATQRHRLERGLHRGQQKCGSLTSGQRTGPAPRTGYIGQPCLAATSAVTGHPRLLCQPLPPWRSSSSFVIHVADVELRVQWWSHHQHWRDFAGSKSFSRFYPVPHDSAVLQNFLCKVAIRHLRQLSGLHGGWSMRTAFLELGMLHLHSCPSRWEWKPTVLDIDLDCSKRDSRVENFQNQHLILVTVIITNVM